MRLKTWGARLAYLHATTAPVSIDGTLVWSVHCCMMNIIESWTNLHVHLGCIQSAGCEPLVDRIGHASSLLNSCCSTFPLNRLRNHQALCARGIEVAWLGTRMFDVESLGHPEFHPDGTSQMFPTQTLRPSHHCNSRHGTKRPPRNVNGCGRRRAIYHPCA